MLSVTYLFDAALKEACRAAGLVTADGHQTVTTHRFRHTVGTQLAERGALLHTIMTVLGHSNPGMSMVYARISDREVLRDYQAVLGPGTTIAGPLAAQLRAGALPASAVDWLKSNFLKTELELGHCLRMPQEGPCECDLYLICAKFVTTPAYAPRLRARRLRELELVEDAAAAAGRGRSSATGAPPRTSSNCCRNWGSRSKNRRQGSACPISRAAGSAWMGLPATSANREDGQECRLATAAGAASTDALAVCTVRQGFDAGFRVSAHRRRVRGAGNMYGARPARGTRPRRGEPPPSRTGAARQPRPNPSPIEETVMICYDLPSGHAQVVEMLTQAELVRRLRLARLNVSLSQEAVAGEFAVPQPTISQIEGGKRGVSSLELAKLARLYRRPLASFFDTLVRTLLFLAAVALWLAAAPPATAAPVPVRVCAEDRDWLRPSREEMARTVWRDNRYADAATGVPLPHALAYYTHHFFFFTTPSPSGAEHVLDMTGLVTANLTLRELCGAGSEPGLGPELAAGRTVAVWVLGYHVVAADLTSDTLTLTVEPNATTDHGYAIVGVTRPTAAAWTARAVLADGREVARKADWQGICCAEEPGIVPPGLPRTGGPPVPPAPLTGAFGLALVGLGAALRVAHRAALARRWTRPRWHPGSPD